jgi:hypothetical protein
MDSVHQWRNLHGADLVTLFTSTGDYAGVAWKLLSPAGSPNYGFSVCRVDQARWGDTLIHELGHNMGCGHCKYQKTSPGPGIFSYSAGWRWQGTVLGWYWYSIMTYPESPYYDAAFHFSNPNVTHDGVATGDPVNGDNARTLRELKGVIANYRPSGKNPIIKNDFSGDGQEDILWRYYGSGGKNVVWYMKGATRMGSASLPAVMDLNWQIVGTGDFNRDGWPDILWRYNGSGGRNVVWYMKGVTYLSAANLNAVANLNWQIVGTGDFNRDGWPDILWRYNGSGGRNVVWHMKGATYLSAANLNAVADLNWQVAGTGDFNRDGWPDILWRYNGSGGKNVVWYMQGATRTGTASLPAVTDLKWKIEGTGDFDGDGWPDILWRYYGSGGKNVVWYMKNAIRTGTTSLPAITDLNWRIENH